MTAAPTYRKKLIEVALPLKAINEGSKPETENPFLKGHPRAIHNWWARTPLSVSRAILFAQLIDDPGNDLTGDDARAERKKLLDFVGRLATWEATTDETLLRQAREMIKNQFKGEAPEFWDMFAGRASIPLEAQRLGLKVTSSDLNPVAVTIQRALLEFPPRYKGHPPCHPDDGRQLLKNNSWKESSGLVEDIRYYGESVRSQALERLKELYPPGPNGEQIVAWIWARTVECPNPACKVKMPLVRSFALASKPGRRTYVLPQISGDKRAIDWKIQTDDGPIPEGTVGRGGAHCLLCRAPVELQYIRSEGRAGRITHTLMAAAAEALGKRVYLRPSARQIRAATAAEPKWAPETELPPQALGFRVQVYGMTKHRDLFTPRQLLALSTLADLINEVRDTIVRDAKGDKEYANVVMEYLACALSRLAAYLNSLCTWNPTNENIGQLFQRQAIPIVWDFAEANPICGKLSYAVAADWVASALASLPNVHTPARVIQLDARKVPPPFASAPVVSTDPPYYDNIGYADLADFFYTWLRCILKTIDPQTFATLLCPKEPELIADPSRHDGDRDRAEQHFREGFSSAFDNAFRVANENAPLTVYYAFKQQEEDVAVDGPQRSSTGWETMLEGLVDAGFQITGTWPIHTAKAVRRRAQASNALASAVVLVARQRPATAPMATRKEFVGALKKELPPALKDLMQANIAPVDLAQASIGPGMAAYSRHGKVLEADGTPMSVRTALQIINEELDLYLVSQEGTLDPDTRFCISWFEQHGLQDGAFGDADVLARARNTSVQGLENAGVLVARAGKVRLLKRQEYARGWDPLKDARLTVWECTQHLIRELHENGEDGAALLSARLGGGRSEDARALAYRLYSICERQGWSEEALAYNSLVVSWPAIQEKAARVAITGKQRELSLWTGEQP